MSDLYYAFVIPIIVIVFIMLGWGFQYFCSKRTTPVEGTDGYTGYTVAMQNRLFQVNNYNL